MTVNPTLPRPVSASAPTPAPAKPTVNAALQAYFAQQPADVSKPPLGFERIPYQSFPPTAVSYEGVTDIYMAGRLPTSPVAAKLAGAGQANLFNPAWQQQVLQAATQNGGLGDSEQGFLAWSSEKGFVRLRHPGMTPEQNRRLAAMSLQTGWPIERLPSRQGEKTGQTDAEFSGWVDKFIGKFDEQLAQFLANPADDLVVKDGSRNRYVLKADPESGRVVSYEYRKGGGFAGFVQSNMDWIGPVLDVASLALTATGAGIPAALALQAVETGINVAAQEGQPETSLDRRVL